MFERQMSVMRGQVGIFVVPISSFSLSSFCPLFSSFLFYPTSFSFLCPTFSHLIFCSRIDLVSHPPAMSTALLHLSVWIYNH